MTRNNQQSAPRAKRKEKREINIESKQHSEPVFCYIHLAKQRAQKIFLQFLGYLPHFCLISSHILIGGRLHEEFGIGNPIFKKAGHPKNVEGAPNILGTPSWIVFRRDERQQKRQFILCQLMEGCEVFAISFLIIKKRKLESSSLVVAKVRSDTSKKRNICYAEGVLVRK